MRCCLFFYYKKEKQQAISLEILYHYFLLNKTIFSSRYTRKNQRNMNGKSLIDYIDEQRAMAPPISGGYSRVNNATCHVQGYIEGVISLLYTTLNFNSNDN